MNLVFINSQYVFSLFANLLTVDKPLANIDINQLVEVIQYGYVKEIITSLRNTDSKEEYNQIKKEAIPCVTLSGVFTYRSITGLSKHSGLMQIDIDKVEDYDSLFNKLCRDNYIYVCFRSPGGKGLKAIIKIKPQPETHKEQFRALEIYFKDHYSIAIDSLCKDVSRAMLLSFDPYIYCNPWSEVFKESYSTDRFSKKVSKGVQYIRKEKVIYDDETIDLMERLISVLEKRKIDITSTYESWIKVGFALCTTFGEQGRNYYHRIGGMYPRYTPEETDRTYTQLLANNNGKTTMGTIIYLAKEAGVKINTLR